MNKKLLMLGLLTGSLLLQGCAAVVVGGAVGGRPLFRLELEIGPFDGGAVERHRALDRSTLRAIVAASRREQQYGRQAERNSGNS